MKHKKKETISLPTKEQVEKERKLYRWKKAYVNALTGTTQNPRERALLGHTNKMNIS